MQHKENVAPSASIVNAPLGWWLQKLRGIHFAQVDPRYSVGGPLAPMHDDMGHRNDPQDLHTGVNAAAWRASSAVSSFEISASREPKQTFR